MTIHFEIVDDDGVAYNLATYLIDFGRFARGIGKKIKVRLHNVGFTTEDISLECIAHPTAQLGLPEDTYDAATLSLSESGLFVPVLTIPSIGPNTFTDVWIQWVIPMGGLPGAGQFAIRGTGKVVWT